MGRALRACARHGRGLVERRHEVPSAARHRRAVLPIGSCAGVAMIEHCSRRKFSLAQARSLDILDGMKAMPPTATKPIVNGDIARARRKQAAVRKLIRDTGKTGKNALGLIRDTPVARQAFAMGEEYRRAQTCP